MMQTKSSDVPRQASTALATSSIRELRHLHVDENDQTLEISGSVRSYYHKQMAQETVRTVARGRQVINRIEVCQ